MTLPNFVIIGAPKAGTTSLSQNLSRHPDIFMTNPKEPNFFGRHFDRGLAWYEQFFEGYANEKAVGEGSVLYSVTSYWPKLPMRLAKVLPDIKLIYMVRHPIERIESMWCQQIANGDRLPPLSQAVFDHRSLLDGSLYWHQINKFREYYHDKKIHVIYFDDYIVDPCNTLKYCFQFLGVGDQANISHAGEAYNQRVFLKMDRRLGSFIRHSVIGNTTRKYVPELLKRVGRSMLRRNLDITPTWDPKSIDWCLKRIKPDAKSFLKYFGERLGLWDLSDEYRKGKLADSRSNPEF